MRWKYDENHNCILNNIVDGYCDLLLSWAHRVWHISRIYVLEFDIFAKQILINLIGNLRQLHLPWAVSQWDISSLMHQLTMPIYINVITKLYHPILNKYAGKHIEAWTKWHPFNFANFIFKTCFSNWMLCILILLTFIPKGAISLAQVMDWHQPSHKPLTAANLTHFVYAFMHDQASVS